MGFFNKFGNFVEDAASFAIPAGLALAGTVATGGLGAIAAPTLLSALGAGAGGFARNEEEERRKKMLAQQARNQGMANLQNALSPGTNAQAVQAEIPKSGFLETSSRGVGQGIQAFQAAQQMAEAAKLRESNRAFQEKRGNLIDAQAGQINSQGQNALGRTASMFGGNIPVTVDDYKGKRGVVESRPFLETGPTPDALTGFAQGNADIQKAAAQAAQNKIDTDLDRRLKRLQIAQGGLNQTMTGLDIKAKIEEAKPTVDMNSIRNGIQKALLVNPALEIGELAIRLPKMDPLHLHWVLEEERMAFYEDAKSETNQVLYTNFAPVVNQDDVIGNAGNFVFSMSNIVEGYNQQNGFGDIAMIIGTVRMTDPAVSVRAEDVKTIEQALAWAEQIAPGVIKAKILEGDHLAPTARDRLMTSNLDLYNQNVNQINIRLDGFTDEITSSLPQGADHGRVDNFLSKYRLRPPSTFATEVPGAAFAPYLIALEMKRRGI